MHCRFVKRFTVSIILLSFGGLWFVSRLGEQNDENVVIKFPRAETDRSTLFFDDVKSFLKSTIAGVIGKSNVTFTEADWMVDILDKNLSKYDTIEKILKEIDKHIPDHYTEDELTMKSLTVQFSSMGESTEAVSEAAEIPTEPVRRQILIQRNITKRKLPDTVFPGFMNVHIWEAWCGRTVEDLRRNKHFPLYPDARTITTDLFVKQRALDFGQRIFGYLHPPQTGYFTFCLSSDDNSELWLSNSSDPRFVYKIAWVGNLTNPGNTDLVEFQRFRGQVSSPVYLAKGRKYFMEILHKQAGFMDHVLVAWKGPGIPSTKMITEKYVSAYIDEDDLDQDVNLLAEYVPETVASSPTHVHGSFEANFMYLKNVSTFSADDHRDHFHLSPMVNESDFSELLPKCQYKPSYLVDFEVNRYEGIYFIHDTAVYPNDKTELTHMIPTTDCENRNIDSHMNLLRPTTPVDTEDEDFDDSKPGDDINSYTISPKISALLSKFQNRFKNFWNGRKGIDNLPVKKKSLNKKDFKNIANEKDKKRLDLVMKRISPNKNAGFLADGLHRKGKKNKANSRISVGKSSNDQLKKKRMNKRRVKKRLKYNDNFIKSKKDMINRRANNDENMDLDKLENVQSIILLPKYVEASNKKGISEEEAESKSLNDYETELAGRKLLTVGGKRPYKYAYEVDDEVMEDGLNKKKYTPIFVPITGVENIKKPVNRQYVRLKPKSRHSALRNADDDDDDDDNDNFQIKSYYKRLNITSNKDVMRYYKIYRFAFYDMIQEIPRIHTWKYKFSLSKCRSDGNLLLNEKVATGIVTKYMRMLTARYKNKYTLKKVVNIEENHDVFKGDRYLIELDLKVKGHGEKSFRLSRYVYQKLGSLELCEPIGFQWNPHADVHVIVPVKDQGRWVQHFIDNMEKIYLETLDSHLNVIIVDFSSTDIDIEASLRRSKLKRYQLIKMDGLFQRALGIQAGADAVKDPKAIIFTCDLHLEIPSALIDNIRKHCIHGKMAFAPIVLRLDCGYRPENPFGLWEIQGYGLFAICKSDFDKAGGMNTKEFKTKWGGEDWEMLDRILSSGIEVERLRIPKFYHHFHSKKRMWNHQHK